jgi:hypothetical protein
VCGDELYATLLTEGVASTPGSYVGLDTAEIAAWEAAVFTPWATGITQRAAADGLRVHTYVSTTDLSSSWGDDLACTAYLVRPDGGEYPWTVTRESSTFEPALLADWGDTLREARRRARDD